MWRVLLAVQVQCGGHSGGQQLADESHEQQVELGQHEEDDNELRHRAVHGPHGGDGIVQFGWVWQLSCARVLQHVEDVWPQAVANALGDERVQDDEQHQHAVLVAGVNVHVDELQRGPGSERDEAAVLEQAQLAQHGADADQPRDHEHHNVAHVHKGVLHHVHHIAQHPAAPLRGTHAI